MLDSGSRVGRRYVLERSLGLGSMGHVWLARDEQTGQAVALKILRSDYEAATTEASRDRMRREARLAGELDDDHVVKVLECDVDGDATYLVMEFVDGESLADQLGSQGRLSPDRAAEIVRQVAMALSITHQVGIMHRDVKPANILLTGASRAKLADFGIARALEDTMYTATGQLMGTLTFMAPEVARGEPATFASDVWSLGATFFAMVEGHPPFQTPGRAASATDVLMRLARDNAPRAIHAGQYEQLIRRALSKAPHDRPTIDEFLRALDSATKAASGHVRLSVGFRHAKSNRQWVGRRSAVVVGVGLAAACAVGVGVAAPWTRSPKASGTASDKGGVRSPITRNPSTVLPRSSATGQPTTVASVLDFAQPLRTVRVGQSPWNVNVTPDGKSIWVVNSGGTADSTGHPNGSISIVDSATLKVGQTLAMPPRPSDIAYSADARTAYITEIGPDSGKPGTLAIIDTTTGASHRVQIGNYPMSVAVEPKTRDVWVANANSNNVSVLSANGTVVGTIPFTQPVEVASAPAGQLVFVVGGSAVAAFDAHSHRKLWAASVPHVGYMAVTKELVCLGTNDANSAGGGPALRIISAKTGKLISDFAIGHSLDSEQVTAISGLAASADGKSAYVTVTRPAFLPNQSGETSELEVLSIEQPLNPIVARTVPLAGANSQGLALSPDGGHLFAVDYDRDELLVLG